MRNMATLMRFGKEIRFYAIIPGMKNTPFGQDSGERVDRTRRRFMAAFASTGLGATLVPGVLWARLQDSGAQRVSLAMVNEALKLAGVEVSDEEKNGLVESANRNLANYDDLKKMHIPPDVSPPFHFSPLTPGMTVNKTRQPFRLSAAPSVRRPSNLEDVAFWPVRHLAELVRTRQVTSLELTEMYLSRLHRYNALLNNVVTFMDDYGRAEAKRADAEIAAGKYRGPLHGIPWGAKDIISVKGYKTTWGSAPFKDQILDYDASVVEQLREAGAVLIAKVTTGELAGGDNWFGGQTKSPWDPTQGSSGSSAGPSSATAAGCIAFGIGTETSGSILSPAARCGLAGLRPTFGRISRYGVMALSWTQDRLGPICRYAEDTAIVMHAIAKPDGRDMSVSDVPFNWNAQFDIRKLRVGIIQESFDSITNASAKANADHMLATFKQLGVTRFIPITVPEFSTNTGSFNVERTAYFEEHARAGRMKGTRGGSQTNGYLIPAPLYLQQQRARMMMMMALQQATAHVDVYIVGSNNTGVGGPPARPAGAPPEAPRPPQDTRPQTPTQRHFGYANLAGYPAINLPNGFADTGSPTNAVIYAQPFREQEIIALAKAYQDAAGFHLRKPTKLDQTTTTSQE
ncbi:MAG TPA: amidase [Vicinamibacterales bacterium]|nr:amidase [Vicinamibacterales bacterium]